MNNLIIKNEILKSILLEYLRKAQLFRGAQSESIIREKVNSFTLNENDKKEAKRLQIDEETYLKLLKEVFFEMAETLSSERRRKNSLRRKIRLIKLKITRLEKTGEEITHGQIIDNILLFLERGDLEQAQAHLKWESDKFHTGDKIYKILSDTLQINLGKLNTRRVRYITEKKRKYPSAIVKKIKK